MQPGVKNQRWKKEDLLHRIEELAEDQSIPFFVLTETHLKPHIKDAEVKIEGYSVLRSDRPERSQGGVAIFHMDNLSSTQNMTFSNKTCEICITQISQMKVTIVAIYRPPDTELCLFKPVLDKVSKYLTTNSSRKNDIFIMGDLNFPNVEWGTEKTLSKCSRNDKDCFTEVLQLMSDHFLVQTVDVPTRQGNILDVVLTNSQLVRKVSAVNTVMSDHKLVTCLLGYRDSSSKDDKEQPRTGFNALNLHKADWERTNDDISALNWDEILFNEDREMTATDSAVKTGFETFSDAILGVCQKHAPPRSSKRRKVATERYAARERK